MADFDESLYAHATIEQVDRFITDHAIDKSTLRLAESYAMTAVLGAAGSTITEDLFLHDIPEFVFKEDIESSNYIVILERCSLPWQPYPIPPETQERIITDLEKNRSLAEATYALISAITYLQLNTEPLVIIKARKNLISDVFNDLIRAGILTDPHLSVTTLKFFFFF